MGTGDDQGRKPLYGEAARRALAREGGKASRPSEPVIDAGTPAREGPRPAADEGKALAGVAKAAAGGDPEATAKLASAGRTMATEAAKGLAANPPKPEEAERASSIWSGVWAGMGEAASVLGEGAAEIGSGVANFFRGIAGKDAAGISGHVGGFLRWLGRLGGRATRFVARALFRTARALVRSAGSAGVAAAKAAWPSVRPFAWWAGSVALGLGLACGPAAAGILIGTPKALTLALALSPPGMLAGFFAVRKLGKKAAKAGLEEANPGALEWKNSEYGCGRTHRFGDLPAGGTADEVALAGKDGARAAALLSKAKGVGVALMTDLARTAVTRMMQSPDPLSTPVLFTDEELAGIRRTFAETIAAADLLGRARVRERARLAEARRASPESFAEDDDDPFTAFAEPVPALPPKEAVGYFGRLVPSLGTDAARYGPLLDRHAFTLAVAADQTVLERVKGAIAKRLAGTNEPGTAAADIDAILDEAGVGPRDPQYAEMVARTNMMDALNQGAMAELQHPEMRDYFPAWRYEGIDDDRAGDDHRPNFGRFFPSDMSFAEVRGPRVWNCRCSMTPVSKYDWDEIAKRGGRFG